MPAPLLKAHQQLDHAVDRCYRPEPFPSDRHRVEYLFALYEQLTHPAGRRRQAGPEGTEAAGRTLTAMAWGEGGKALSRMDDG
jgi:hypothetical protein